jgi:hypothetical protein
VWLRAVSGRLVGGRSTAFPSTMRYSLRKVALRGGVALAPMTAAAAADCEAAFAGGGAVGVRCTAKGEGGGMNSW